MLASAGVAALVALPGIALAGHQHPAVPKTFRSALTPAQIERLARNPNRRVIVLLRNQYPGTPQAGAARDAHVASSERPITSELARLHARNVHAYRFVSAISATMSAAEAARLRTDPLVRAVVPDTLVQADAGSAAGLAPASAQAAHAASASGYTPGGGQRICSTNPNKPLLEPEALKSMNVDNGPGGAPAAHSLADGSGVRIAVFPDGLDPNIPDFRTDGGTGPSAIFDYEDFSGEGKFGVTGGGEAFGDASSIISQGNQVFDLKGEVNPAHPLPTHCYIRILGVAPGARVAVMKVFGDTNFAFNSTILQGIDYAVTHDHVNILSESFGGNPVPNPGNDPIAIADQDAIKAGITVVASTGDAGPTNTIGTPASVPSVISPGATTDYRLYAQTTSYGIQFGNGGWVDNQISGLSSSGVTDANHTIDLVAPGEANWADCSTDTKIFTECSDVYNGPAPQPIEAFGGTSESAPFTAATAALVIQAYRETHGGTTPSPATVQRILMSTAKDLDTRATDQGAGLIDAYRAVQAARSYGSSKKSGDALLYSPNSIDVIASPHHRSTTKVTVTNDGTATQTVRPQVRALGAAKTLAAGTLQLNQASDPTFTYQTGQTVGDVHTMRFQVPKGTDRLETSIAWDQPEGALFQTIRFDLFNPKGQLVIQSRPQGPAGSPGGGFSQAEVHNAPPGTWKLLVFDTSFSGPDDYSGPLVYKISGQSFHKVAGSVQPASATIPSGKSATFHVTTTTPGAPGDSSESLAFGHPQAGQPALATVPITLRSLVTVGKSFTGVMQGGNARMSFYGEEDPYAFTVKGHPRSLEAEIHMDSPGYQILAFLVGPSGVPADVQSSALWDGESGTQGQNITLFQAHPQAGRWKLMVVQANNVESLVTSTHYKASVRYNVVRAKATGLVDSAHHTIASNSTATAKIRVTNTGNQPEEFVVDARHDGETVLPLTSITPPTNDPLPITNSALIPQFLVPPFSSGLEMEAKSTVPIRLDTSPAFGTPDVEGRSSGNIAVVTYSAPQVPDSEWSCAPSEQGPFSGTAKQTRFSCGAVARTNPFATDVSTSAGSIWQDLEFGTSTYNPLVLAPGQSGTIKVKIHPTAARGKVVKGFLALETFNFNTISSDKVATFPYAYKVK